MYGESIRKLSPHYGRDRFFEMLRTRSMLMERKRSYIRTANPYHRFRVHGNSVRECKLERPNQVWVSDITYIRMGDKFAYLSLTTDGYSRKIAGWRLSGNPGIEDSLETLKKALATCSNPSGIIHHLDRGIRYCSHPYTKLLTRKGMQTSMTEENHCYENGLTEWKQFTRLCPHRRMSM
jgi:transposase InsO family protein